METKGYEILLCQKTAIITASIIQICQILGDCLSLYQWLESICLGEIKENFLNQCLKWQFDCFWNWLFDCFWNWLFLGLRALNTEQCCCQVGNIMGQGHFFEPLWCNTGSSWLWNQNHFCMQTYIRKSSLETIPFFTQVAGHVCTRFLTSMARSIFLWVSDNLKPFSVCSEEEAVHQREGSSYPDLTCALAVGPHWFCIWCVKWANFKMGIDEVRFHP